MPFHLIYSILFISLASSARADIGHRPLEMHQVFEVAQKNVTALDIFSGCRDYDRPDFLNRERISRRAACNGFFFGAASTVAWLRRTHKASIPHCFPESLSTEQIIRIFLEWAYKRDDLQGFLAVESVLLALDSAFPCHITDIR